MGGRPCRHASLPDGEPLPMLDARSRWTPYWQAAPLALVFLVFFVVFGKFFVTPVKSHSYHFGSFVGDGFFIISIQIIQPFYLFFLHIQDESWIFCMHHKKILWHFRIVC